MRGRSMTMIGGAIATSSRDPVSALRWIRNRPGQRGSGAMGHVLDGGA